MLALQVCQGDIAPIPALTLTDQAGGPVNLFPFTSLTFRMVDARDGHVQVDSLPATKVQSDADAGTWGQVMYQWRTADTNRPGLYRAWFILDQGSGPTHYPIQEELYILIEPENAQLVR
jgi:hypothetical protein